MVGGNRTFALFSRQGSQAVRVMGWRTQPVFLTFEVVIVLNLSVGNNRVRAVDYLRCI